VNPGRPKNDCNNITKKYNSMGNSWRIEFNKAIDTAEKETV
jgi:hypothetical protein